MTTAARGLGRSSFLTAAVSAFLFVLLCPALRAGALSEEASIPGGTAALARVVGLDTTPDRPRFITELTRVIYESPKGASVATDGLIQKLTNYLESTAPDQPADTVPIPLSAKVWSALLQRPIGPDGLVSAIIRDRRAALLCYGLAALDDETLQFLNDRPALLSHLYEHDAAVFAAFAESVHVRGNVIASPGGESARLLWETVLGESAARPEPFMRELFSRHDGRIAYLYDTLAHLDTATRAFGLGLWIRDPRQRVERFKALVNALNVSTGWAVPDHPFRRPPDDPMLIFQRVVVDPSGVIRGPASRGFWSEAIDSGERPDDPSPRLANTRDAGSIDAAWLVDAVVHASIASRAERLDQLAFGLRAFVGVDDSVLPDALVAVRAFPRYRMLMLTLERMGPVRPATYTAAARHAARLSALDATDGFRALSQFQGSIAILGRLVAVQVLDVTHADSLVASLAGVPCDADGWYRGGVARWLRRTLIPALGATSADGDTNLLERLAGIPAGARSVQTSVTWEGRAYSLDVAGTEARRLARVLGRLGAPPIARALAVESIAETLSAPALALADVPRAQDGLARAFGSKTPAPAGKAQTAARAALRDLSTITTADDLPKAARVAESLRQLADEILADAVLALAYALNLGDGPVTPLVSVNSIRRHDFGFAETDGETRVRTPWREPAQQVRAGIPWHVRGSLLGLELGLSNFAVRGIASDALLAAPVLAAGERDGFTKTVALLHPSQLRDEDRDEIAQAIERGRRRVGSIRPHDSAWLDIADEIALDGRRRRAVQWTLEHEPQRVLSFFSLGELLYLGRPSPTARLHAWGVDAGAHDGCFCAIVTPPGRWRLAVGRWPRGIVAPYVLDLNLRVALALAELKLPAALARGVLATATQDYVDRVRPLYADDWLTFVRTAQALPGARIDDYVAALTINGPLVPQGPQ